MLVLCFKSDENPLFPYVNRQYQQFHRGRCSVSNKSRGSSPEVVLLKNINALQNVMMQNRYVIYSEIETLKCLITTTALLQNMCKTF